MESQSQLYVNVVCVGESKVSRGQVDHGENSAHSHSILSNLHWESLESFATMEENCGCPRQGANKRACVSLKQAEPFQLVCMCVRDVPKIVRQVLRVAVQDAIVGAVVNDGAVIVVPILL
jgi:hypothetical protein